MTKPPAEFPEPITRSPLEANYQAVLLELQAHSPPYLHDYLPALAAELIRVAERYAYPIENLKRWIPLEARKRSTITAENLERHLELCEHTAAQVLRAREPVCQKCGQALQVHGHTLFCAACGEAKRVLEV